MSFVLILALSLSCVPAHAAQFSNATDALVELELEQGQFANAADVEIQLAVDTYFGYRQDSVLVTILLAFPLLTVTQEMYSIKFFLATPKQLKSIPPIDLAQHQRRLLRSALSPKLIPSTLVRRPANGISSPSPLVAEAIALPLLGAVRYREHCTKKKKPLRMTVKEWPCIP